MLGTPAGTPLPPAVSAERWLKWSEDHLAGKRQLVKKIHTKNALLKQQISKLEASLRQKEEQGDSLHSIDFHQLRIENSQFTQVNESALAGSALLTSRLTAPPSAPQKIKEKNNELLRLKLTTGKTTQLLNAAKVWAPAACRPLRARGRSHRRRAATTERAGGPEQGTSAQHPRARGDTRALHA